MEKKLNKVAKDTNLFLKKFLKRQKKTHLVYPMEYGLLPGGKRIRSKLIVDVGKIFNLNYKKLLFIAGAVECIHAYSLIHDDLPCMDNDRFRRGKLSTHIKFGESTAILAGSSLLTLAFEILSQNNFKLNFKTKIDLINKLSNCTGHSGLAGGQFMDLNFEKKKVPIKKIIEMQTKKTGKIFSYCCVAPIIISKKTAYIKKFEKIGTNIGILFQIVDDLIDYRGDSKIAGKKTKKDIKKGKATLISLLGYKNTINYGDKLKFNIFKKLDRFGESANDLKNTINFIMERAK